MTIGLFSIFHAVLSLECYSCNNPEFDYNDLNCTHPTPFHCPRGSVCAKSFINYNGEKFVTKYCARREICKVAEFTVNVTGDEITTSCCKSNLCNGLENIFQNKVEHYTFILIAVYNLSF